ncbi:MAG: CBS domain-containing protein [Geminicoccaceae bacterium]
MSIIDVDRGRQIVKTAADVMTTDVLTVTPETLVARVAAMILDYQITALPVVDDEQRLLGIVSEDDVVRLAEAKRDSGRAWWLTLMNTSAADLREVFGKGEQPVSQVMSRDVVIASENTSLRKLTTMLSRRRIKQVPILRDGKLVGLVSRIDILRYLAEERTIL